MKESKMWRVDIGMWETQILSRRRKVLAYVYSVFREGYILTFRMTKKYKKSGAKYFYHSPLKDITVTCDELHKEYSGNKWIIPINKKLSCQ